MTSVRVHINTGKSEILVSNNVKNDGFGMDWNHRIEPFWHESGFSWRG